MKKATTAAPKIGKALPDVPTPFALPFYYANLTNCAIYYLVDPGRVQSYLEGTGLSPAIIDSKAVVSFNFQVYAGAFSSGPNTKPEKWLPVAASVTQELELNIASYPTELEAHVSQVNFRQYMLGEDQSKLIGNHRVWVPCDSDLAIGAGKDLFGEPKFKTSFAMNLPAYNPGRAKTGPFRPVWEEKWGFRVNDPDHNDVPIFTCIADTTGLVGVPAGVSPITEYGVHENRLIGCRWEILGPMQTYILEPAQKKRVKLTYGASTHPMKADMQKLIGNAPAAAVQMFISSPAAIQHRAYFP